MLLPPGRPGRPAPADLAVRRAGLAQALAGGMWRADPAPREMVLGGVRALRFDPPAPPRTIILHFHGGAFRIGCPDQVASYAAALAARCGVSIICPAYRLAPEHPFPAALHDAKAVFDALRQDDGLPIIFSGDSAGGGLAASLAAVTLRGVQPPVGLILLSAWLDLTVTSASYAINAATDPLFSRASASEAADLYLQGAPATDPLTSPLLGDLDGFPPTFVSVGAGEVLLDDARGFHARLQQASVSAWLDVVPGMEHVAVTRGSDLSGSARTFEAVAAFVDSLLA